MNKLSLWHPAVAVVGSKPPSAVFYDRVDVALDDYAQDFLRQRKEACHYTDNNQLCLELRAHMQMLQHLGWITLDQDLLRYSLRLPPEREAAWKLGFIGEL